MKNKTLKILLVITALMIVAGSSLFAGNPHFTIKDILSKNVNPFIAIVAFLIPITAIAGTIVFSSLFIKWWHQRKLLMIEKGMIEQSLNKYRLHSLLWGIILFAVGSGIIAQQLIIGRQLKGGIVVLSIGAGLLIFRKIITGKDYQ